MQLSTHDNCVCSGTWDWMSSVERSGSMPAAMYCAAVTRVRSDIVAGSWPAVIECRSATKNTQSLSSCMSTQLRSAPT